MLPSAPPSKLVVHTHLFVRTLRGKHLDGFDCSSARPTSPLHHYVQNRSPQCRAHFHRLPWAICPCKTLGTVPVPAGIIGDGPVTALRTGIDMTAQRSRATALNGPKSFELLKTKARAIPLQKAIALCTQNVGHLQGGPSHSCFFRLKLRLTLSVPARVRPSSGLLTACKCRRDRCRYWAVVSRSPCPSRT